MAAQNERQQITTAETVDLPVADSAPEVELESNSPGTLSEAPPNDITDPAAPLALPYPDLVKPSREAYEEVQDAIWTSLVARQSQAAVTGVDVKADVLPNLSQTIRSYYQRLSENSAIQGKTSKGASAYITDRLCAMKKAVSPGVVLSLHHAFKSVS